jgi:hypothetical protein
MDAQYRIKSDPPGLSRVSWKGQGITATGSPAEDKEEERALDALWNLKDDVKCGIGKANDNLSKTATPARSHVREVLSVFTLKKIRGYCQDVMNLVFSRSPISCIASIWLLRHRQSR